jgi:hypothetical protein
MTDFGVRFERVPLICDNTSAISVAKNLVLYKKMRQVERRHHFLRDHAEKGDIEMRYIDTPNVVIGMFLINGTSTVVLFDFRASHSFISATYVGKHNLPLALVWCQMIVSSLGGDMPTRQLCPKVNLKIRG